MNVDSEHIISPAVAVYLKCALYKLTACIWCKILLPHALAHSNQCIQIREMTLKISSQC